jgi:23S rRNA (uracil1939-C5)-methyltransferase
LCGGCAIQHWNEQSYRRWKHDLVVSALSQARIDVRVDPLVDAHGEGRRRAVLHARRGGRRNLVVGFSGRRSHHIVPIDGCPIFAPPLEPAPTIARRLADALEASGKSLDFHFTATQTGLDVDIRGVGTVNPDATAALARIASEERLARLTLHGELVAQLAEPVLKIGRAAVVPPPGVFLQATTEGEKVLAALVTEALGNVRRAVDLFCGIGTFALRIAESAQVLAVDQDADAIAALRRAKSSPGLKPVEAVVRDLFRSPLTAGEVVPAKLVVMDPPRQGAEAQVRELAHSGANRVVYVSCNPATFARDAQALIAGGFKLVRVVPIDQFRYSAHVELVGIFDR